MLVALAAPLPLAAVAATHAATAGATLHALAGAHVSWALVLLGLAAAGILLQSGLLRAGQGMVGARFGHWEAVRLAAAIHAANLAVRAAGAAGLGVLLASRRDGAVGGPEQSAAYVLGREIAHIAFAGLVLTALVLAGLDGHLSLILVAGGALFFLSRLLHVLLLCFAATHPHCLPRWRRLDQLRAHAPTFAAGLRTAAGHPRRVAGVAAWAAALDLLRVGWLWVALHAVGAHTSVDATVESYGVVALLGPISILPAGLGTVDAGLVATLHHAGLAMAVAVAGVLLFRVADLWLPLAAGARPALAAARGTTAATAPLSGCCQAPCDTLGPNMQRPRPSTVGVCEDDDELRGILRDALQRAGFAVRPTASGSEAVDMFTREPPDAVVLDIGLPDADGRDVCQALRTRGVDAPVLFLTARGLLPDRLSGFHAGGDDYLTKPFAVAELLVRVESLVRRNASDRPPPEETPADFVLDPARHGLRNGACEESLTPTEFRVLAALAAAPGDVVRTQALVAAAWPEGAIVHDNTLHVFLARIRRKLRRVGATTRVETVRGVGYRLR